MPRNGSGTYTLPAGNPVVTGTTISSTVQNNTTSDIATALTASIAKDGQTTPTANLPMGTYRHTGVGNGVAATDYAALGQVQSSAYQLIGTIAGVDTITGVLTPTLTAYAAGQKFSFVSAGANTGAVTINIDSLGAKNVTKFGTTALVAGDIPSGALVNIEYDGTRFQLCNLVASTVTNLSGGSAGTIPYQSAAGTTAMLAAGTAGYALIANGAAAPVWTDKTASTTVAGFVELATDAETLTGTDTTRAITPANLASVNSYVKLTSGSVSAAAALSIVLTTYQSSYRKFRVTIDGARPATNAVTFQMRTSNDGGSTYTSSAGAYDYVTKGASTAAASQDSNSSSATAINLTLANVTGNGTTESLDCVIDLYSMNSSAKYSDIYFHSSYLDQSANGAFVNGSGHRLAAEVNNAIQFFFSSGNITELYWSLEGSN